MQERTAGTKQAMSDETQAGVSEVRPGQRIAKVMARAGVCSRRDAEAWIAEGRVSVNSEVLKSPAFNVSEDDDIRVDGKPLAAPERTRLFLFHKPRGLVTTARDPEGRATVFARLPPDLPRLVAIGRLDINTEGLLLLTNDGGLARVLELPSTGWLRRYRVRAHGVIDQAALDPLAEGVVIDGVDYRGVEAKLDREQGSNAWLTLGLREGKNREIKKILEHLGLAVNRLIRVSFGPFELGDLPEGEIMEVRTRVLRDQLGVKLAKEANANFDAGPSVRDEPAAERGQGERPRQARGPREARGRGPAQGRPERGAGGASSRFERDAPSRRAPPKPSTPERRRKHVSALRAEIAADVSDGKGPRKRIERGATQDRKGRRIAVERISLTGEEARKRAAPETRPKRAGRPRPGERVGRPFEAGARFGKSDSFGPKRGAGAAGRERAPRSDHKEPWRRPEGLDAGRREGDQRERRFDRPKSQTRDRTGESRPPRADAKARGPRPESRQSRPGARDSDRPRSRPPGKGPGHGPPRGRSSPGGSRPPGKAAPKGRGGSRPPPRKP
jgi:23S rRNA pseudouridine2605 synthase